MDPGVASFDSVPEEPEGIPWKLLSGLPSSGFVGASVAASGPRRSHLPQTMGSGVGEADGMSSDSFGGAACFRWLSTTTGTLRFELGRLPRLLPDHQGGGQTHQLHVLEFFTKDQLCR